MISHLPLNLKEIKDYFQALQTRLSIFSEKAMIKFAYLSCRKKEKLDFVENYLATGKVNKLYMDVAYADYLLSAIQTSTFNAYFCCLAINTYYWHISRDHLQEHEQLSRHIISNLVLAYGTESRSDLPKPALLEEKDYSDEELGVLLDCLQEQEENLIIKSKYGVTISFPGDFAFIFGKDNQELAEKINISYYKYLIINYFNNLYITI